MTTTTFNTLSELESVSGSNAKLDILRRHRDDAWLKWTLWAALDPYTVYNVGSKVKTPVSHTEGLGERFFPSYKELLNKLSSRALTGNAAKSELISFLSKCSSEEQKWAVRIILRNLRIGVQEATIDKVWPGLVKSFSVALAETLKGFEHVKYPVRVEPKLDGLRLIAVKKDGVVTLFSRNGRQLAVHDGVKHEGTMPTLCLALVKADYDNVVLDGEGLASGNWNDSASVIMSHTNEKDDSCLVFNVFDAVPFYDWERQECSIPYNSRCSLVTKVVNAVSSPCVVQVEHIVAHDEKGLRAFYSQCMDRGFEGVMLKTVDTPYTFKRSKNILKLKPVTTFDGKIVAWHTGRVNTKHEGLFGGFDVLIPREGREPCVTRVGGGFNDALRAEIQLMGADSFIGRFVEIEAQPDPLTADGLTVDGKARFPVFIRFRDAADVSKELLSL